jgi:hypothetical protein
MRILSAILNEDRDPAVILARSFHPAHVMELTWRRLTRPKFHMGSL